MSEKIISLIWVPASIFDLLDNCTSSKYDFFKSILQFFFLFSQIFNQAVNTLFFFVELSWFKITFFFTFPLVKMDLK